MKAAQLYGSRSVASALLLLVSSACGADTAPSGARQQNTPALSGSLPCAVSEILASNCQSCHGATPLNGAPMPLVTLADLNALSRVDMSHKVYELVAMRIQDRARPMPPDPTKHLSDTSIGVLQSWAAGGAQPGAACVAAPAGTSGGQAGVTGSVVTAAGSGGVIVGGGVAGTGQGLAAGSGSAGGPSAAGAGGAAAAGTGGAAGGASDPLDADIEKCYELHAHGQPTPGDKTSYTAPTGETYTSFIFKSPWTTPVQGLRFRHLPDNAAVVHHWLLYSESANVADGSIDACALAGASGILCGQASTRSLITGWAPGRGDFRMPAGVGLELPAPGALMALEFHYNNNGTGMTAQDKTGVEICVTSKFRTNTAAVTWLGSRNINVPAHAAGDATGTCTPLRKGMNATDPIHFLYSWPHMHKLGTHLKSVVMRAAGGTDVLYDGDFSFQFQLAHESPLLLQAGDKITTTCSFQNTTDGAVTFGQSTDKEMCFNFAYAWPGHALDNAGDIGGATNTCLH
jgi:hypothetical protein